MKPEMALGTFFLCYSNIYVDFFLTTSNLEFHKLILPVNSLHSLSANVQKREGRPEIAVAWRLLQEKKRDSSVELWGSTRPTIGSMEDS